MIGQWYNPMSETHIKATFEQNAMLILVVDDDPPSVKMIAFLLREEGYDVITASNGREALRLVEERAPDLIILDIMMPHIDGLEVCRRIRERSDVPIIFLSAKGETSDRVLGWARTTTWPSPSSPRNSWRACAQYCGVPRVPLR